MKISGFVTLVLMVFSNSFCQSFTGQKKIPAPASDLADWQILVEGKPILTPIDLASIWTNQQIDEPSVAEISLNLDPNKLFSPHFYSFDKDIQIRMGYHQNFQTVFEGRMVVHQISSPTDEPLSSIIHCEGTVQLPEFSPAGAPAALELSYGTNILEFDLSYYGEAEIEGMILIPGTTSATLGHRIKLNGLPSGFNKEVVIRGMEHLFHDREWRTVFHVRSQFP